MKIRRAKYDVITLHDFIGLCLSERRVSERHIKIHVHEHAALYFLFLEFHGVFKSHTVSGFTNAHLDI